MSIYLSYKKFPELAAYTPRQKRIIWINFIEVLERTNTSKKSDVSFLLMIVGGFLIGASVGYFSTGQTWATALGIAVGVGVPMCVYQIFLMRRLHPRLVDYMKSDKFSLEPVSERAKKLVDLNLP